MLADSPMNTPALICGLMLGALLSGCASTTRPQGPAGPPPAAATPVGGGEALAVLDIEGSWRLIRMDRTEELPREPAITLGVEGGRVTGDAGCNRYFGEIVFGPATGTLRIGPLGSTRRACASGVMALEDRFLDALGRARRYAFSVGHLVLVAPQDGGEPQRLVFERVSGPDA